MNIEFIMHGAISGQSFSKQDDMEYCKQFYGHMDTAELMCIDVAKGPLGVCSYCSYIRSGNVVAERTGSYLGMTVRIDGYVCTDVKRMWQVLDCVFHKMVVGKILMPIESVYKYCIDNFQCSLVEETERYFLSLFGSTFVSGDFRPISDKDVFAGTECVRLNLEDDDGLDVGSIIDRKARICLSPSYPTRRGESLKIRFNEMDKKLSHALQRQDQLTKELETTKQQLKESRSESQKARAQLEETKAKLEKTKRQPEKAEAKQPDGGPLPEKTQNNTHLQLKEKSETKGQMGEETGDVSSDKPKEGSQISGMLKYFSTETDQIIRMNFIISIAILLFLMIIEYGQYLMK